MPEYVITVVYKVRIAADDENVAFDRAAEGMPFGAELERMTAKEEKR